MTPKKVIVKPSFSTKPDTAARELPESTGVKIKIKKPLNELMKNNN